MLLISKTLGDWDRHAFSVTSRTKESTRVNGRNQPGIAPLASSVLRTSIACRSLRGRGCQLTDNPLLESFSGVPSGGFWLAAIYVYPFRFLCQTWNKKDSLSFHYREKQRKPAMKGPRESVVFDWYLAPKKHGSIPINTSFCLSSFWLLFSS